MDLKTIQEYLQANWDIIPLQPNKQKKYQKEGVYSGKEPKFQGWQNKIWNNTSILQHFKKYPKDNIGLRHSSTSKLCTIGIDFDGSTLTTYENILSKFKKITDSPFRKRVVEVLETTALMQSSKNHKHMIIAIENPIDEKIVYGDKPEELEVLGKGQSVLPPSICSKFDKKGDVIYEDFQRHWIDNRSEIKQLSNEDLNSFLEWIGTTIAKRHIPNTNKPKETLQIQEPIITGKPKKKMRRGFQELWDGTRIIPHKFDETIGKREMDIWRLLVRECLYCGYTLEEYNQHFVDNPTFQPEFKDGIIFEQQNNIGAIDKKPSNKKYNEYFPREDLTIEDNSLNCEWEIEIQGDNYTKKTQMYKLSPLGIHKLEITIDSLDYDRKNLTPLWVWDSFHIDLVLIDESVNIDRYDFEFNKKFYKNKEFNQMVEIIYPQSLLKRSDKQIFGPLIHKYIKDCNIQTLQYSQICGFTKEGWKLPDQYRINFTIGIQEDMGNCIEKMSFMNVEKDQAIQYMNELYNSISAENKDLIFAISLIEPFLYALKEYSDLMPCFCFYSDENTTGKTHFASLITKKFWNNLERDYLNQDNFSSISRIGDYLTSSTFGVVIDDCGELSDDNKSVIKTSVTGETSNQKKNMDQSLKINKKYTNPMIFTFNTNPELFEGIPMLSRSLFIPMDKKLSEKDKAKYKKITDKLPEGYIGKYIYNQTKEWTIKEILEIYNEQGIFTDDIRQNTIYRLVKTGSILFEKFFGISLEIEDKLKEYIKNTVEMGSDEIFTVISDQIKDGIKKRVKFYDKGAEDYDYEYKFYPKSRWITTEIVKGSFKNIDGYFFTHDNIIDLKNRIGRKKKLPINELKGILKKQWKNIPDPIVFTVDNDSIRGIFIPEEYITTNENWEIENEN